MNGQAAKASRRDLRKAFGGEAVDTLDRQAEAIGGLAARHDELSRETLRQIRRIDIRFDNERTIADEKLAKLESATAQLLSGATTTARRLEHPAEIATRGFLGRLKWIVSGR